MSMKTMSRAGLTALLVTMASGTFAQGPPMAGAVFTTDSTCQGVNLNIYAAKGDVYLNGGPARVGAAGLPDGNYFVRVTDPSGGTVLGFSNTASVLVAGGEFMECYRLVDILFTGSSGFTAPGYDDTPNNGGEYKVWVSADATFPNNATKTDNFKVKPPEPASATLEVIKFYDANVNGVNDDGQLIAGWQVQIQDDGDHPDFDFLRTTPVSMIVDPGTYVVTESTPVETNWLHTTANPVTVDVPASGTATVEFGNACLGAGGGKTLGFWSNKNGQATMAAAGMAAQLAALSTLSLRNADGADFDPGSYAAFRTWLLSANATNMAYMLSAQLSATSLNATIGGTSPSALVHAPGCGNTGVGSAFISIADLIAAANASLAANAVTINASPERTTQECLKDALDNSNNNRNFVQSGACAFSFAQ